MSSGLRERIIVVRPPATHDEDAKQLQKLVPNYADSKAVAQFGDSAGV